MKEFSYFLGKVCVFFVKSVLKSPIKNRKERYNEKQRGLSENCRKILEKKFVLRYNNNGNLMAELLATKNYEKSRKIQTNGSFLKALPYIRAVEGII